MYRSSGRCRSASRRPCCSLRQPVAGAVEAVRKQPSRSRRPCSAGRRASSRSASRRSAAARTSRSGRPSSTRTERPGEACASRSPETAAGSRRRPCGAGRYCGEVAVKGPRPLLRVRLTRPAGRVSTVSMQLPRRPAARARDRPRSRERRGVPCAPLGDRRRAPLVGPAVRAAADPVHLRRARPPELPDRRRGRGGRDRHAAVGSLELDRPVAGVEPGADPGAGDRLAPRRRRVAARHRDARRAGGRHGLVLRPDRARVVRGRRRHATRSSRSTSAWSPRRTS